MKSKLTGEPGLKFSLASTDLTGLNNVFRTIENFIQNIKNGKFSSNGNTSTQKVLTDALQELSQLNARINSAVDSEHNLPAGKNARESFLEKMASQFRESSGEMETKPKQKTLSIENKPENILNSNKDNHASAKRNEDLSGYALVKKSHQAETAAKNETVKINLSGNPSSDFSSADKGQKSEGSDQPSNRKSLPVDFFSTDTRLKAENTGNSKKTGHNGMSAKVDIKHIIEQIVQRARLLQKGSDRYRFTANLKPQWLGKLTFQIDYNKGNMVSKFLVETVELKEILQANLNLLKKELADAGIEVKNFEVFLRDDNGKGNLYFAKNEDSTGDDLSQQSKKETAEEKIESADLILQNDQLLDLRA